MTLKQHNHGLINWIKQTLNAIQEGIQLNLTEPPIKIANVHYNKNTKTTHITLQMSGKNNHPTLTASEILQDATLVKMLLEDDYEYINALADRDQHGITCKLLRRDYSSIEHQSRSIFTIMHIHDDAMEIKKIPIQELTQTFHTCQFNSQDAFVLGLALENELQDY